MELCRRRRLVVGEDLKALIALVERAFGRIRIRRGERRAHILEPDAVFDSAAD
jgi:hypothetical protein